MSAMQIGELCTTLEKFKERNSPHEFCILCIATSKYGEVAKFYMTQEDLRVWTTCIVTSHTFVNGWTTTFHNVEN